MRQHGFTLIEMIAALAIIAAIAASLYGTVRIAFKAQQRAEAGVDGSAVLRRIVNDITLDLQGAVPTDGVLQREFLGENALNSSGANADSLTFCCNTNTTTDGADVQMVEYAPVERDDHDGFDLVRNVTHNLLAEVEPTPDQQVLATHVREFNLRYYDGTQWLDTWDASMQNNLLPLGVEVIVRLDSGRMIAVVRPPIAALLENAARVAR